MRFLIKTLGCKQNSSESELLREHFESSGWIWSDTAPDLVIIHSCAVTNRAEYKSRDAARRMKKKYGNAKLAVIGCAAQNSPGTFESIGADIILDNHDKFDMSRYTAGNENLVSIDRRILKTYSSQSRAFLSIQDGCDLSCAYCIITKLRGPSISKPQKIIMQEIDQLKISGKKEIVLTGINTGLWGRDLGTSFTDLVKSLSSISGIRFRLSSLNPDMIDEELIRLIGEKNSICPHLHISLQSASFKVLQGQRRYYKPERFIEITRQLKAIDPNVRIGLDIIAGLPLEDQREFEVSEDNLKKASIDYMHIFRFSPRKGTDSASMKFPSGNIAKARAGLLNKLDTKLRQEFLERNLTHPSEVVLENRKDRTGAVIGMTDNYLDVGVFTKEKEGIVYFRPEYIENGRLYGR